MSYEILANSENKETECSIGNITMPISVMQGSIINGSIPQQASNISTWASYSGTSTMYDTLESMAPKLLEIELLDGSKLVIRLRKDDVMNIQECIDVKKKLVFKLPFPKYETTKTTYVKFFNKYDNKEYTVKCTLPTFMNAIGLKYTSFGEILFDSAISGVGT